MHGRVWTDTLSKFCRAESPFLVLDFSKVACCLSFTTALSSAQENQHVQGITLEISGHFAKLTCQSSKLQAIPINVFDPPVTTFTMFMDWLLSQLESGS